MSIKSKLVAGVSTLALAGGALMVAAPAATAAPLGQPLLTCTGTSILALLNPTLGSGDAKYAKASIKRMDATNAGKYHTSLTGAEDFGPATVDATACVVDSGIRTNNAATDSTKANPFDNQTNGQAFLTMTSTTPFTPGIVGKAEGSASCNRADTALATDYPASYPLQGKLIYKWNQADAASKQIQNQFYVRLGTDPADTDITHITATGIVIKGPGIGGQVDATFGFGAAYSTKNVGLLDCTATTAAGNASLAALIISPVDGPDGDATVDPLTVTIPAATP